MTEWRQIDSCPNGRKVRTKIEDAQGERNQAILIKDGNLFWIPGADMYVYYTPTHWAELEEG